MCKQETMCCIGSQHNINYSYNKLMEHIIAYKATNHKFIFFVYFEINPYLK